MRPFKKKTRLQRLVDTVNDAVDVPSGKATKAGLITASGLAALTAANAGISSLRRRGNS